MKQSPFRPRLVLPSLLRTGELAGVLAVSDTPKPEARATVRALKEMGFKVVLLTGDNRQTASAIAQEVPMLSPSLSDRH